MCCSRGGGKGGEEINEGRDYAGKCMGKRKGGRRWDKLPSPFPPPPPPPLPLFRKRGANAGKTLALERKYMNTRGDGKMAFRVGNSQKRRKTLFLNVSLSQAAGAENAILHGGFLPVPLSFAPPRKKGKKRTIFPETRVRPILANRARHRLLHTDRNR